MRSVEVTIHHLIRNGFTARHHGNPCAGMVYTAFQERATRISHGNVARLAAAQGDEGLARICRRIAGDESRHETFYTRIVAKAIERDPEEGVLAFREMLRGIIAMPGRLMDDGRDPNLFEHFASVAQRIGVYTARTYSQIIEHLLEAWGIAHLSVSGKAAKAQEYLCRQPERYALFADEIAGNCPPSCRRSSSADPVAARPDRQMVDRPPTQAPSAYPRLIPAGGRVRSRRATSGFAVAAPPSAAPTT